MSYVPTRFIHAANLRLDHQPQGIAAVSESALQLLEDCTLTCFSNLIQTCLDQEVDFLLLTGNTFVEADHSIRARIALIDGFQKLAARNIPVLVIPGESDPLSAWDLQYHWPENVNFFSPGDHERFDILRDTETVATLQLFGSAPAKTYQSLKLKQRNQLFNKHNQRPLSIGCMTPAASTSTQESATFELDSFSLAVPDAFQNDDDSSEVAVDYLSLYKGTSHHTFEMQPGVAHHPGTPQGLNCNEYQKNGVTLATVNSEAPLELRRLKVAPVRWLPVELQLEPHTSAAQLRQLMKSALLSRKPGKHEQLWMIRWNLTGSGSLLDSLDDSTQQAELISALQQELEGHPLPLLEHVFQLQFSPTENNQESGTELTQRYLRQVASFHSRIDAPLERLIAHAGHLDQTWHQRLSTIAAELDEQQIFNTAIRNGQSWLNISTDEELHS
ncbi:putative metallophosphoesterase YhaO [Gimesia panareensis]|uniref:Putative metallophosphoesterase YhaO n=1 Tax=Gimesia panareensis TaxID=2527978 RepID=A0A518FXU0_9PLAN|nr:hypothetical protein [Gimesia panareensis]QDV21086.1 putative metallophosphoesterase YhaO [Gimesia panareensis]